MLCVPSARHVFGTASLASSALSASAELLVDMSFQENVKTRFFILKTVKYVFSKAERRYPTPRGTPSAGRKIHEVGKFAIFD